MLQPRPCVLFFALLPACGGAASSVPDAATVDIAQEVIADAPSDRSSPDAPLLDASRPDSGAIERDAVSARTDAPDVSAIVDVASAPDVAVLADAPDAAPPTTFLTSYPLSARFPEGGTYDPSSHRFFVGSLADGSVHRINATTGQDEVFYRETAPGRWWTLGMDVDVARRRLAVCSMEDRRALGESAHPYDGYVLVFDLESGMRVARYPLAPAFATATCTDVAFSADGGLYVCDREHPQIYRIEPNGTLSNFVSHELLSGGAVGQNALVVLPDQSALLSLIYLPSRLVRVSLRDRSVANVSLRGSFFDGLPLLSGADGMTLSGNNLLVAFTSQVTRVTPTLGDWSAASTATIDVPAGMTDIVHTPGGDYLLNGQAVSFAFDRPTTPFEFVRFVGTF